MSLMDSFATFVATSVGSTIGQDLFKSQAPSSQQGNDSLWWITRAGGQKTLDLPTGAAIKSYIFEIYYRNIDGQVVEDELEDLEEALNSDACTQLTGFTVIDVEASVLGVDQDLDNEDRQVGLLQANVTIYKE